MISNDGGWAFFKTTTMLLKTFLILFFMAFVPFICALAVIAFCDLEKIEKS